MWEEGVISTIFMDTPNKSWLKLKDATAVAIFSFYEFPFMALGVHMFNGVMENGKIVQSVPIFQPVF